MKPVSFRLRLFFCALVVVVAGLSGSARFADPQDAGNRTDQNAANAPVLELLHVQGNVSMLVGAGGNIAVQVGKDGVLLVDSGGSTMTEKVLSSIRTLSKGQITYIVNT